MIFSLFTIQEKFKEIGELNLNRGNDVLSILYL